MPELNTEGIGTASLEAKIIRADGTEEDLGVIAGTVNAGMDTKPRRFICESPAANIEFPDSDPPLPPAFLARGQILTLYGPVDMTVTEGTIRELGEEEE